MKALLVYIHANATLLKLHNTTNEIISNIYYYIQIYKFKFQKIGKVALQNISTLGKLFLTQMFVCLLNKSFKLAGYVKNFFLMAAILSD